MGYKRYGRNNRRRNMTTELGQNLVKNGPIFISLARERRKHGPNCPTVTLILPHVGSPNVVFFTARL
jgi:hypothetical protein